MIAQRGWKLYSFDVSQAFLRGITFQELSDSGESQVMRHVELDLPPGSVSLLQSLPGYSDFNAATETLSLIKPGYGLKDAPRLWNLALTRCLVEAGLRKLQGDEQLFVKHVGGVLVLIVSTHVDDLKAGGEDAEITALVKLLESRFDALKTQIGEFEHLGLVHKQYADYIEVHQNQYIAQLRTINSADVPKDDLELLDDRLKALFMSLLGGVGWVVQTRPDVATYVGALQRHLQKPCAKHIRQLNRIVRYLKAKPLVIRFSKLPTPTSIGIISDSAFSAADADCLAVRSGIISLLSPKSSDGIRKVSPIEWVSKKQQHVCRSTYAAELHSGLDLTGLACVISAAFNEIVHGSQDALTLSAWQNSGYSALPMHLFIDARAVFDSITAEVIKTPADGALLVHAKALREYLDKGLLSQLHWIDTRDMVADALNKGIIDRTLLREFFSLGKWHLHHESRDWPTNVA